MPGIPGLASMTSSMLLLQDSALLMEGGQDLRHSVHLVEDIARIAAAGIRPGQHRQPCEYCVRILVFTYKVTPYNFLGVIARQLVEVLGTVDDRVIGLHRVDYYE